ncbi:MAG: glycerol dehydrogenase [Clostridiales Family XIII bacterium]|jgi:glycerol dehydrogenase|nr:glycerol dehydrogenase [Clostridiales Family XIII bacterium]
MINTLAGPGKYYQGENALLELGKLVSYLGDRFLVLSDDIVYPLVKEKIEIGFSGSEKPLKWSYTSYGGESTQVEADRVGALAKEIGAVSIIGIGGGKLLDTAKLAADESGLPVVIVPTSAATDAPSSSMSVVYTEDGIFVVSKRMRNHPDIVLVDTTVIAGSPLRTFIAGIGDAFSCYYEARACKASGAMNYNGGRGTALAYHIPEYCNLILRENAKAAVASVKNTRWSEALDRVSEAILYMGGVGFENTGCTIPHGVYNGMTAILRPFGAMHGEAVALGVLIQLAAEKVPNDEWNDVVSFYRTVGLPECFAGLGVPNITDETIMQICEKAVTISPNVHKEPFEVDAKLLFDAIKTVETRSKESRQ